MLKIQYQQPDFVLINQENMVNDLMLPCIFNIMMVKKAAFGANTPCCIFSSTRHWF